MSDFQQGILVVDDQQVVRHTLALCLQNLGFTRIYQAENGREARKILSSHSIRCVFCDLNMPVEDGFEVLKFLDAQAYPGAIILMSGEEEEVLASTANLARLYQLNIIECVAKPLSFATVKRLLSASERELDTEANHAPHSLPPLTAKLLKGYIDKGGLSAFFQPQISLSSGRLKGFEVLARLFKPDDSMVFPDQFIPTAEKHLESITDLTKRVIECAYSDINQYGKDIGNLSFAFNISAKVLEAANFPQWLQATTAQYQLRPEQVICELTETAFTTDQATIDTQMLRLKMMKFKLSIDDFGTGYSSIAQLHSIPFDELKVDKRFVLDCLSNTKSAAVVEQSIQLAKAIGVNVVAEGIENQEVCDFVKALGCDIGQGYFYAKPEPLSVFDWRSASIQGGNRE